jgi:hypothetical protein
MTIDANLFILVGHPVTALDLYAIVAVVATPVEDGHGTGHLVIQEIECLKEQRNVENQIDTMSRLKMKRTMRTILQLRSKLPAVLVPRPLTPSIHTDSDHH